MIENPFVTRTLAENGYVVLRSLGRGASGSVVLAKAVRSGQEVAVKIVASGRGQGIETQRRILVRNEITLGWKLFHPYLITVYGAFADARCDYLVMEHVAGGDLRACTRKETLLPVEDVLRIGHQCCLALGYAARSGVIHRDIKPANLLRAEDGDIRISDFGGAIFGHLNQPVIADFGSPAYMSPEQIRGEPLDARSDMFALSIVLYQLLTGCQPFDAPEPHAAYYKILYASYPPLERLRPALPSALVGAIARGLMKDKEQRWPCWEEYARHLDPENSALAGRDTGTGIRTDG